MKLNEAIYAVLRSNLDQGLLSPGTPLRETEVARVLDVGRVPVRAALGKLSEEGLLLHAHQRGFSVPGIPAELPTPLVLEVSPELRDVLQHRNWRGRLFGRVELEIAAALAFGSFRINETRMAEHLGVSRTVVREFLGSLDRIGLVHQLSNGRWQAEQLTSRDIADHYALRRALEPLALRQVAPELGKTQIETALGNLDYALRKVDTISLDDLLKLETELHVDVVLATPNRHMADVIRRSQLPMISTNISFATTGSVQYARETICEHHAIFDALAAGKTDAAAQLLDQHLQRAEGTTQQRLSQLDLSLLSDRPGYLEPVTS